MGEITEQDQQLFNLLNNRSGRLRSLAKDLAVYLGGLADQSPETRQLIAALNNINEISIDKMDEALDRLQKDYLVFSQAKFPTTGSRMGQAEQEAILKKMKELFEAIAELVKASFELNQ